jgi:alanyl-tRNA synthetase
VRLIKLLTCVKFHQGVRIEMVCGQRAIDLLGHVYDQNRQVSQAFSARILETGDAARKVNERLAATEYRAATLQKQVFSAVADSFAGCENVLYFGDLTPGETRELAQAILPRITGSVMVCGGEDGKISFCLASHADVKAAGSALCAALGGRGGGKPPFFQGSLTARRSQIEEYWNK